MRSIGAELDPSLAAVEKRDGSTALPNARGNPITAKLDRRMGAGRAISPAVRGPADWRKAECVLGAAPRLNCCTSAKPDSRSGPDRQLVIARIEGVASCVAANAR